MSGALIFASTNPQYDGNLFIELQVQYKLQGQNMLFTQIVFVLTFYVPLYSTCKFMYLICDSMNNLLSYSGLVDARISASEKDLPV